MQISIDNRCASRLNPSPGSPSPRWWPTATNDIMVPTKNTHFMAGHLPNSTVTIYPDANHGFLFQYPTEFAAEVNTFLS